MEYDDAGRRWCLALLEAAAQLFIFVMFAATVVGKIASYGWWSYVEHLTNWSWTLQTLFYGATLAVPFMQVGLLAEDSALGRFTQTVLTLTFFPLNGLIFLVVVVISVLLGTDGDFLNDLFINLPPAIVVLGNDIFHFWPLIFILVFYIAYHRAIFFSLNRTLVRFGLLQSAWRTTFFILLQAYVGTTIVVLIYSCIFDPHKVYQTDIETIDGVVVSFVALTVFNLLPLMVILGLLRVGTNVPYSQRWLAFNDADPQNAVPLERTAVKFR